MVTVLLLLATQYIAKSDTPNKDELTPSSGYYPKETQSSSYEPTTSTDTDTGSDSDYTNNIVPAFLLVCLIVIVGSIVLSGLIAGLTYCICKKLRDKSAENAEPLQCNEDIQTVSDVKQQEPYTANAYAPVNAYSPYQPQSTTQQIL